MFRHAVHLYGSLLLAALIAVSQGHNVVTVQFYNPKNLNQCTVPAPDNLVLAVNQVGKLKSVCGQVKCLAWNGRAQLERCNKRQYAIPENCTGWYPQLTHPTNPFPKCCEPIIECNNNTWLPIEKNEKPVKPKTAIKPKKLKTIKEIKITLQ